MLFEIHDGGCAIVPRWLKQILEIWLSVSVRPFALGFVLCWIGLELEFELMLIAGVVLCCPLIALAIFFIDAAPLATAVIVPLRLARKLTTTWREETWKTPASVPSADMWDAEMDSC